MSSAVNESVLLAKNVLSLTTKNSNQILFECGRGSSFLVFVTPSRVYYCEKCSPDEGFPAE